MNARPPQGGPGRAERGATLLIAMVMLLVIGLSSVSVMRNVGTADGVANNVRLRAQAGQAAQLALQFCIHQIELATPTVTVFPAPVAPVPPAWTDAANWLGRGTRNAYTLAASTDFVGGGAPPVRPQCLIEQRAFAGTYSVTARGFSPDFQADSTSGIARAGAVVWLQADVWAPVAGQPVRTRTWQQLAAAPL